MLRYVDSPDIRLRFSRDMEPPFSLIFLIVKKNPRFAKVF